MGMHISSDPTLPGKIRFSQDIVLPPAGDYVVEALKGDNGIINISLWREVGVNRLDYAVGFRYFRFEGQEPWILTKAPTN